MLDERVFRERLQEIERLIAALDGIPDERTRMAARELVQRVTELHGAGLEKVLEIVFAQGGAGAKTIEKLAQDRVLGSLMVLHGLHPDDLETRVRRAIEDVAARLRQHDVELQLLGFEEGNLRLRAVTSAPACGSTAATVRAMIEETLYEAAPDIASLTIEGLEPKRAGGFVALDQLGGSPVAPPELAGKTGD